MEMTPKSGALLAVACIAAVAAVGCVFELASGTPDLGEATTWVILLGSIPLTVFSFLAAVQDTRANQK